MESFSASGESVGRELNPRRSFRNPVLQTGVPNQQVASHGKIGVLRRLRPGDPQNQRVITLTFFFKKRKG